MKSLVNQNLIGGWYCGTGRRKTSIARVFIKPGRYDVMLVNGQLLKDYFERLDHQKLVRQPILEACPLPFVVKMNVVGGGKSGQAGAIQLGIARALVSFNPDFRRRLSKEKFLKRDSREVERKKVGLCKARKGKQFSKR
ncbi:30S ribosomal subunit protein S9 [Candidatus Tremblaya phenacola PAVE]|nr:30S ribosomal subunit protein S9 [Candidatus Tremblaya phenacola PAVE]